MTPQIKVSVRQVVKRFGATLAADHIDLDIQDGEFLTLLGASGCGKTTLMRIVAGFESVDAGSISIDSHDVTRLPPRQRRLGMVFQQYSLFPHMTVADNVGFGLRAQGMAPTQVSARVNEMLALVQLPELRDRKPSQLSGGQQQRVALARALATRPSVLMLDEPLGALDLKLRRQLQAELKRIHRETGSTFLFVTHDQEEALYLSDRIAVMRGGRIEQLAAPQDIYLRPVNAFVADFIGDVSLLDGRYEPSRKGVVIRGGGFVAIDLGGPTRTVRLVVRPENAVFSSQEEESLSGVVTEVSNQTGTTLYGVSLRSGQNLMVRSLGLSIDAVKLGQQVWVLVSGCQVAFEA